MRFGVRLQGIHSRVLNPYLGTGLYARRAPTLVHIDNWSLSLDPGGLGMSTTSGYRTIRVDLPRTANKISGPRNFSKIDRRCEAPCDTLPMRWRSPTLLQPWEIEVSLERCSDLAICQNAFEVELCIVF